MSGLDFTSSPSDALPSEVSDTTCFCFLVEGLIDDFISALVMDATLTREDLDALFLGEVFTATGDEGGTCVFADRRLFTITIIMGGCNTIGLQKVHNHHYYGCLQYDNGSTVYNHLYYGCLQQKKFTHTFTQTSPFNDFL
jgi:hypothetical protein